MEHIARESKPYRKTLCNMGFGPPKELTDPDDIDKHFAAALKLAPLQCFHCLGEGHKKPQCPLFRTDGSSQPKQNAPQGRVNEGQSPRTVSQTPSQTEVNALEQRVKKQMEEMEKRMLQAISALAAPRQNIGGQRANQAKAVRASMEEETQEDDVSAAQEPENDAMSESQRSR